MNHQLTYYVQIELLRGREAILARIIEIKVLQSESMLILELVQGSQMIKCLGLRAVRCRVNRMILGKMKLRIYIIHELLN